MDTSTSVLGKRTRTTDGAVEAGKGADGNSEKRPGSAALEAARAVDLEVVKEHAQWWNPELEPHVEAHQSSIAEGVDGAAPAWVADECNRARGQELSPEEEQRAELVQAAKIEKFDAGGNLICSSRERMAERQIRLRRCDGF